MSKYTQYFTTSAGSHLNNRCIFAGSQSVTWPVPEGTTEVHVHVWGGGGGGCKNPAYRGTGGGGGGYARASLSVTDSDTLAITVGGSAGTSSVTVPTQSPGSPISATGGGNAGGGTKGAGGSGTVALAPTQCNWYCFTATGGEGGCHDDSGSNSGGGAAGSPLGTGGAGGNNRFGLQNQGYGGGIGDIPGNRFLKYQIAKPGAFPSSCECIFSVSQGGSHLGASTCTTSPACCAPTGFLCYPYSDTWCQKNVDEFGSVGSSMFGNAAFRFPPEKHPGCLPGEPQVLCRVTYSGGAFDRSMGDEWFYVEDMAGSASWCATGTGYPNTRNSKVTGGAGAGGGGILAGGNSSSSCQCPSQGGCAGGSGSGSCICFYPGSPGMVVIYW
tara:strand:- start:4038 stop:5189 length:1152 start_codon:yes stop_codon:yes gene_type:complete